MKRNEFISEQGELGSDILLNIAEMLALRLPEGSEKAIAAKWVKKFLECDPKAYKHYLSLFICSLTKQVLVEPFDKAPGEPRNQWQDFDQDYSMDDIKHGARIKILGEAFTPEYKVEISSDLKEYLAFQEIPHFGAHFYYAFSPNESINHWLRFNKLNVPKNHVIALEKAGKLQKELLESPVKGRFSKKTKGLMAKKLDLAKASTVKKPKSAPKPRWEGAIEEEPEPEPEPPKKNMISIPTGVPVKAIPPALQRRMLEAENKKQERIAENAADRQKQLARAKTPARKIQTKKSGQAPQKSTAALSSSPSTSASATPRVRESLRKTLLQKKALSRGESLADEFASVEEPLPYGPLNRVEFYRDYIDKKKKEMESVLIPPEIPNQLLTTSHVLEGEMERTRRELTPNIDLVNEIQDQEIEIGQKLMKVLDADQRVGSVLEGASEIENDFKELWDTLTMLNKTAAKPLVAPATIKKFQALKERASLIPQQVVSAVESGSDDSSLELIDIEREMQKRGLMEDDFLLNSNSSAEEVLDLINHTAQVAQEAIENLELIQPKTTNEQQIVEELIENNNQLIEDIAAKVPQIINAVENAAAPDLMQFTRTIAAELRDSINFSNENDREIAANANPTENALLAADIQDKMNEELMKVLTQVEQDYAGEYIPKDDRVRRYFGHDIEDELIDIDQADIDFEGGFLDEEEFFENSRAKREEKSQRERDRTSAMFAAVAFDVQLENIEEEFAQMFDESLEAIDEAIEELEMSQTETGSPDEMQNIELIKQRALQYKESLLSRERQTNNQNRVGGLLEGYERHFRGGRIDKPS